MNLSIRRETNTKWHLHLPSTGKKVQKKEEEQKTLQQQMIEQFREKNSPENKRITEIYNKFRAGNELTAEELEYLAKNSPEMYKQVKQILLERQALERQMEQAETKEEVAEIHMNELNKIQATMGKGEEAAAQAETTMARVNQMRDAYVEYTATLEYKEKEDAGSRAEDQREQRELIRQMEEEQRAELAESREELLAQQMEDSKSEEMGGLATGGTEENAVAEDFGKDDLQALKDAAELLKSQQREEKVRKRRHSKQQPLSAAQTMTAAEYDNLRLKVRDLYRTNTNTTESGGMNLKL